MQFVFERYGTAATTLIIIIITTIITLKCEMKFLIFERCCFEYYNINAVQFIPSGIVDDFNLSMMLFSVTWLLVCVLRMRGMALTRSCAPFPSCIPLTAHASRIPRAFLLLRMLPASLARSSVCACSQHPSRGALFPQQLRHERCAQSRCEGGGCDAQRRG